MSQKEFLERWRSERDMYVAWGEFIQREIELGLERVHPDLKLATFLKIKSSRAKEEETLLGKAFFRDKPYQDPYLEIEDKVGVRFVVLLTADIAKLQQVIEASAAWTASLDKDFEAERDLRPLEFVYQSKHYVLKAAGDTEVGGVTVPIGTPCEVQLRTLLQHAHSELTHDNIYKRDPASPVTKRVERVVAKSMALIEAVDDYFVDALKELRAATEEERAALKILAEIYAAQVGVVEADDKSNALVIHAFKSQLGPDFGGRLNQFLDARPFIAVRIRERIPDQYLFRQPWVLLAYLMVDISPVMTAGRWPLTPEELRPIYTDLGRAFPGG